MAPIVTSVEVDRPAEEVFAYATDPARFRQWQKGVVDGHLDLSGATPQVGDWCPMTRRIGRANRVSTSRLDHIDPPRTWGVVGIDGPIRATVEVTVRPLTSTRSLTISVDFHGHGVGAVLVPLIVRGQARKEMPGNVAALRQRLEEATRP